MIKKLLTIVFAIFLMTSMFFAGGCTSYMNHLSVQDTLLEERIVASGHQESITRVSRGEDPKRILKFIPVARGGEPNGLIAAVDISNPSWWQTIKAAPGKAALWGAVDGLSAYGLYLLYDELDDGGGSSSGSSGGGGNTSGNDTIVTNGDGNEVNTGGGLSGDDYPDTIDVD